MKLPILNQQGQPTDDHAALSPSIFGITSNDHILYLAIKRYRASQRQGTSQTKERWAATGSTRKLRKQKGSGSARVGDAKSPLRKGGGRTFGPQSRDHSFKLNKKQKQLARHTALSHKAAQGKICIVKDFDLGEIKTKTYRKFLSSLGLETRKTLLVLPEAKHHFVRSARNLQQADVTTIHHLHTYAILRAEQLIISAKSLHLLQQC